MSGQLFFDKWADATWLRRIPFQAGIFAIALGVIVVIGWLAHWTAVVEGLPGLAPMRFNTAVNFIFCGAGLVSLARPRAALAPWLGLIPAIIGLLTLLECVTGRNFFIDELFVTDYIQDSGFPGRMSPMAAACFFCLGAALMIGGLKPEKQWRLAVTGLLACTTGIIAFIALFGYAFSVPSAYGWGSYSRMAVHAAIGLFILAAGLLVWAWQTAHDEDFNFLRWLPVTASLAVMAMIGFVSAASLSQLKYATDWRKHSYDVLDVAQNFRDNIFSMQQGMRNYVLTGQTPALQVYQDGADHAPRELAALTALTHDNPGQRLRVKLVADDLTGLLDYSRHLIEVRNQSGLDSAVQLESNGEGFATVNRTLSDLQAFTDEERHLLSARSAVAESNFRNAAFLLVFGSVVAAVLLLLANLMASREVKRRKRAEQVQLAVSSQFAKTMALQNAILSSANYAIVSTTTDGVVTTFNAAAERGLGYLASEIIGKKTMVHWHDPKELADRAQVLSRELGHTIEPGFETFVAKARIGGVDENQWTVIRKDGGRYPVSLSVTALLSDTGEVKGFLGVLADITERKRNEQKIADSLREKEALLREIHHRVKNNMQIISSILHLQTFYVEDTAALDIFEDCQGRIRTMALIHEKLYRSDGLSQIAFKDYLESLVGLLLRSQDPNLGALRHELEIEPITLDVEIAIPLALIANELISNSLKHAFAGQTPGVVRVILKKQNDGRYQLSVQDDGKGLPPEFDPEKTNSLGVRLVKILSSQINGQMEFRTGRGTEFSVTFEKDRVAPK